MPQITASLSRRFAWLVAVLVAVPTLLCAVILHQVGGMKRDADRLLEETRESGVASRLVVRIESLYAVLESGEDEELTARFHQLAGLQLEQARATLESLHSGGDEDDPSRAEHQSTEEGFGDAIGASLDAVGTWLRGDQARALPAVLADLERGRRFAAVLAEETFSESVLANSDVERRARASLFYAVGGLLGVLLASAAISIGVAKLILGPLVGLRTGADRLRSGDLDYRIKVHGRDEIAALGRAFNEMADEIGRSHAALEHKIETRTLELIRAARLADVGVLAAGIAHEINNPLASIASSGEGLLRRLGTGATTAEEQREYLETIVSEAYRTRTITSRLLDLSRPASTERGSIDAAALFRQVETLTRQILREKQLALDVEVAPNLPAVEGEPGELLQVLLNLILNARDASPPGASIRLVASDTGDAQLWQVIDAGSGIAPKDLERIFDPFFTTKAPGVGTGLGLSLAAAIVDRHGGTIDAVNGPGGGAVFSIRFAHRTVAAS